MDDSSSETAENKGPCAPMQRYARFAGTLASSGLVFVIAALIGCSVWGAITMQHAAARTRLAVIFSDRYQLVERQLWMEASLVRVHGLDPQGSGWYEERAAAIATDQTLSTIRSAGSPQDGALVLQTVADHQRYLDVLLLLFSQIDANAPEARRTYKRATDIFDAMQGRIGAHAAAQHRIAVAALSDLSYAQTVIVRTITVAAALGSLLLLACLLILRTYRQRDQAAQRERLAYLERTALTDALTGLGNHRAFQEELERELARMERNGGVLSLAVLDIDNFKSVNDSMGHLCGDRVLVELGQLLGSVRKADRSFRVGGDEFVMLLPLTESADASIVMRRICRDASSRLFGATISVGLASTVEGARVEAITLRAQADAALYAAKQLGRNTIITYLEAHHRALVLAPEKENAVRRLVLEREMDIAFQPIWNIDRAMPLGYEALTRPNSKYDLDGPQEAFDVAERSGQSTALDIACLNTILCRAGVLPLRALLFLNIVPSTLGYDCFVDEFCKAIEKNGFTPDRVVIELTERSMAHIDVIVREAKRLKSLGFKLALDDTGAGNAGLDILRQLSVDYVKIDRAVLMQAMADPIARAIVAGIVDIAYAMGSSVIAEGVESVEEFTFVCNDVLRSINQHTGVRAVQGYLLGRPKIELLKMVESAAIESVIRRVVPGQLCLTFDTTQAGKLTANE